MKKILLVLVVAMMAVSCNNTVKKEASEEKMETSKIEYKSFGDVITDENVVSKEAMQEKYASLKPGDTVAVKFKTEVKSVCQSKGCWMRMDLGEEEAMVKFKDYAFFMPKDIAGQEVIVDGVAFVEEMSVDEQRHYAEDAGKTPEEVAAITAPKRTLSFMSNGVLIPVEDKQ
ncbi:DUF4920 domain-containing protein [Ulvibacter litoralis]|uniref:DUF4920 domain-containing protein n=1 Tax=Ulvibacter litoralis TaxID=227084 RepID=A0A1G7GR39_9FLAO|nr:DUF4920 domain-containing protein [Ulvibacter litoralis]GHC55368.1 hypothetical protein GCM10008083_19360 [Ulvibacter litoralis]SDE90607.1 protein of unknown function [Ulvibacter litoralis]